MLKLCLKPGEYVDIGEDVRVIISGREANDIYVLIEAPREKVIARSSAVQNRETADKYYTHIKKKKQPPKSLRATGSNVNS